jgi:capsid protein
MGLWAQTQIDVSAGIEAATHQFSSTDSAIAGNSATSGYDAINPKGRRKSVSSQIRSEDAVLNARRRQTMTAQAMDLHRNAGLAAWAIRQHLNYVTLFDLYFSTPDKGLNTDLSALIARDNKRANCDVGGRHSWNRMRRLAEVRKMLDGDVGIARLRSGYIQGVEGNTIVDPDKKYPNSVWEQGCLLGPGKRALAYNVRETVNGKQSDRMISAANMFMLGAFEGRFNQTRGISSFSAGINEFRDFYETVDYARAKVKVEQLIALAITREKEPTDGGSTLGRRVDGRSDTEIDDDEEASAPTQPTQVSFGDGPVKLDMDPGEKAEFLNAGNPSNQTQDFLRLCVHLALLSADIPMNFFDPKYVNMSGGRTTWNQYERSCVHKREDQLDMHEWYTNWRLARYILPKSMGGTGEIVLPRSIDVAELQMYEWVPRGVPWWKPGEELDAELKSVAAGIDTPQKICRRRGTGDFYKNLEEIKRATDAAAELGIELKFGGTPAPFSIVTPDPADV